jgi:hypothetical protein
MQSESKTIDSALILGYISILGYYSSYNYIKGFNDFYKLPEIFYNPVTINSVLLTLTGIGTFLIIYFAMDSIFKHFYPVSNSPIAEATRRIFGMIIILLAFMIYVQDNVYTIFSLIIIGLILFFTYIFPLIAHLKTKGYSNKMRNQLEILGEPFSHSLGRVWKEKSLRFYLLLIMFLFTSGSVSTMFGSVNASKTDEYTITREGSEKYIVMNHEEGKILVAPFNQRENVLIPEYKLLEDNGLKYTQIKINSLRIKKIE